MTRKFLTIIFSVIFLAGCSPLERQAYTTIIGAGAFIKKMSSELPGCKVVPSNMTTPRACTALDQARSAKDLLIDALEVYCAGPSFDSGGSCNAPKKSEPRYEQLASKLRAALATYNQAASDLKGAVSGPIH